MPNWDAYKRSAKERGSLALELYVAETTPVGAIDAVKEHLPAHLAYQQSLERAGTLVFAGPLSDLSGELMQGCGMMIYRAASMQDARQTADSDPMHASGARHYTLRKWLINEGSLSFNIGLSTQSVDFN